MRGPLVLLGLASSIWVAGCADVLGGTRSAPPAPDFPFRTQAADITMLFDPWYTGPQLRQAAAALAQNSLPSSTQVGYVLNDGDGDDDYVESFYGSKAPPPALVPALPHPPARPSDPTGPLARQYAQRLQAWNTQMARLQASWREQNAATTQAWERAQAAVLNGLANNRWSDHGPEDMCCEDWRVERGIQDAMLSYQPRNPSDPATIAGHVRICIVFANLGLLTPSGSLPAGSLSGVHMLVVNYDGPTASDTWRRYFGRAGAADTTAVPAALTDAELPGDVAGLLKSPS